MTAATTGPPPIALVTGAGQGIGAAIAQQLARDGHHVYVNDLDLDRARSVAAQISASGGSAGAVAADVADSTAVGRMFDQIEREAGAPAVLVNNAGIGANAPLRDITDEYWDRVMAIDLTSVLHCTRRAVPAMRESRRGSVVNVSSRAWLGWWGQSAYAAAKAGVVGLSRSLAIELSSRGVRVNAVAPGLIDTPLLRNRSDEALARLLRSVPSGQMGRPSDVAHAVSFLASDRARTITGQVLYVCGGKSVYAYPEVRPPQ